MADSRAVLKAFFETGDIPTQAQFAALIDGVLSIVDDSNLKNGIKIKSETDGKIQIQISDDNLFITNDGDTFNDQFLTMGTSKIKLFQTGIGGFVIANPASLNTVINIIAPGRIAIENIPTFANNAAAISGGLAAPEIYKTATGELRIVV